MDKALVSHETALTLFDLSDNIPSAVHLLVPRRHKSIRPPKGVVLHSHPDNAKVARVTRDGIAVEAPARALVDSADTLQPGQLEMALRQALQRGLITRIQVMHEATRRHKETRIKPLLDGVSS